MGFFFSSVLGVFLIKIPSNKKVILFLLHSEDCHQIRTKLDSLDRSHRPGILGHLPELPPIEVLNLNAR